MAALSADTARPRRGMQNAVQNEIPAAANAVWYAGSIIMNNGSGYGIVGADTASCIAVGVATEGGDNTGGSAGDLNIPYIALHEERFAINSTDVTIAHTGTTICVHTDNEVTDAGAATNDVELGICTGIESSQAWVRIGVFSNTQG